MLCEAKLLRKFPYLFFFFLNALSLTELSYAQIMFKSEANSLLQSKLCKRAVCYIDNIAMPQSR